MQGQLFDFTTTEGTKKKSKTRRRVSGGWELVDHACKICSGRILRRVNADGTEVHRCCECGESKPGGHEVLCWCGAEVRGHGFVFECFKNKDVSLNAPQEILVRERPLAFEAKRTEARRSNPVRCEGY